ncbi:H-NS histone family protein [Chitinimonas naiadis]
MTIDLSKLSLPELQALQVQITKEIPQRQAADKQKALEDLKKLAAERGFNLGDLLGTAKGKSAGKVTKPVAAKYRSKDGSETWSGRGRKPKWVSAYLAQGGQIDDLAVE